jgi:hypothetical protein
VAELPVVQEHLIIF